MRPRSLLCWSIAVSHRYRVTGPIERRRGLTAVESARRGRTLSQAKVSNTVSGLGSIALRVCFHLSPDTVPDPESDLPQTPPGRSRACHTRGGETVHLKRGETDATSASTAGCRRVIGCRETRQAASPAARV